MGHVVEMRENLGLVEDPHPSVDVGEALRQQSTAASGMTHDDDEAFGRMMITRRRRRIPLIVKDGAHPGVDDGAEDVERNLHEIDGMLLSDEIREGLRTEIVGGVT